jgi:hypothetical protein
MYFFDAVKMSGLDPDPFPAGSVINRPPGSESVSRDYGSVDPYP